MSSKHTGIRLRLYIIAPVFLMLLASEGSADMFGWFKRYEVALCPEIQGRLSLAGEPLKGVKVLREVMYDKAHVQSTLTDENGSFRFPSISTRSGTPGKLFDETRIRQVVVAEHGSSNVLLWLYTTGNTTNDAVIANKLSSLKCDLADKEIHQHFPKEGDGDQTYNIKSACRW
ncbi:carboxypeptidase-like regulatory domain-containing protein [Hydrocarboniclastica marina]|uniref:Carboxypeptidase regulatory-like domain-containing protein n=1 Tax=Hydrocarboniclastica marina TaxID=2259620 RepID=A0A4P7XHE3_9ALTE|nr:carboxypeptidase-like regulatory domain-containing protein [Hydrocarboniclastica marina]QCF26451.1 carboxypeptidase regulatory-like domain-containing protein [Hydrocarboniclastica marina]